MNEQHNPWTVLGSKEVYDNNWITVTEYDVLNPSGGKGIYGKVHFKNIAVAVIVLDSELNTYLVGQYRFVIDAYSWEIPEGGGSFDADVLDSAKRELQEEAGLEALEWTKLCDLHLSDSISDEKGVVYLARKLKEVTATPEETEQLAIKKLPFNAAYAMVENGSITDALAVIAITKVKILLLEGRLP